MAYPYKNSKGVTYHLHGKIVTLKGGRKQQIYWFAKVPGANAVNSLPAGYQVVETKRTGLPVLKKS